MSSAAFSQKKYSKKQFKLDSLHIVRIKLARPQVRLDNKITFYDGDSYTINGFDIGAIFKEKFRLTLGYYSLSDELSDYSSDKKHTYLDRHLRLQYVSINTEYVFLNKRFVSLGVPIEFGFGENRLRYKTDYREIHSKTLRGFVSLIDFGLSGTFKPIRWIGIRGVIGYRKTIINDIEGFKFDGIFISFGIPINLWEISKDVKMFQLKKKYKRLGNPLEAAVDLISD